jgi:hypothetical protein
MKLISKLTQFQVFCCLVLLLMSTAFSELSLAKAQATNDIAEFFHLMVLT